MCEYSNVQYKNYYGRVVKNKNTIKVFDPAKPFILSLHKFYDTFGYFEPTVDYILDINDAVSSEWGLENRNDLVIERQRDNDDDDENEQVDYGTFELHTFPSDGSYWLCINFKTQTITREQPDEQHLLDIYGFDFTKESAYSFNQRGWFIVDYQTRRMYTTDSVFAINIHELYMQFYTLGDVIYLVLKNLPHLVFNVIPNHVHNKECDECKRQGLMCSTCTLLFNESFVAWMFKDECINNRV